VIHPSIVGKELGEVRFPIERSKLAELSRAYGDDDPAWHDPEVARGNGFTSLPMPPTATILGDHWRPGGILALAQEIGADPARLLHGEASWEILGAIKPGDELTARQRVQSVKTREGKRGGTMTVVTLETEFSNRNGDVVVRRTDALIEAGVPS
jgi:N-terminal half of MaoC dehydratase